MAKDRQKDKKLLEALAKQAAKSIKTESDLNDFLKMLTKVTAETALNAELDDHLGYDKHEEITPPKKYEKALNAKVVQ